MVAKLRRITGTKRVGHAGTLDPLATGVLVVGVGKATRLLGHLALGEKEYLATIRLGQATDTCDAEGTVIAGAPAGEVTRAAAEAAARALTGEIQQVPPAISAIKVDGARAHRLARAGTTPVLAARPVTVQLVPYRCRAACRRPAGRGCGRDLLERHVHPGAGPRHGGGPWRRRARDRAAPDQGRGPTI